MISVKIFPETQTRETVKNLRVKRTTVKLTHSSIFGSSFQHHAAF